MTNHAAEWVSIREAALTLGVSELTVRRRIKDGKLPHRLTNGKYFVSLNGLAPTAPPWTLGPNDSSEGKSSQTRTQGPVSSTSDGPVELRALLTESTRLAEAAGRAGVLEEQLRDLEKRHAELQQAALSLANRNGWLESRLEEREASLKLLTDERRRPSWWKRVFGSQAERP